MFSVAVSLNFRKLRPPLFGKRIFLGDLERLQKVLANLPDEDYVYLDAKEQSLDFDYIRKECEVLGIRDFEEQSRSLCKKDYHKNFHVHFS